jgi:hypothetical protein
MDEYDVIDIGLGSGMNLLGAMMPIDPVIRLAMINRDEPSCGQAYPTSEGKFCSYSEMYRITAEIFGRKRPVVAFQGSLQRRWCIQFIWWRSCGEVRILCGT